MAEDSSSSNCLSAGSKPLKQDTMVAPSPRYKGVLPQQNGRWGCQIYANKQRIWLGTFKSKEDAARAYESAALKLQVSETLRNFPSSEVIADELAFQSIHSTETVLNMIKDGSYPARFADYLKTHSQLCVETELRLGPMYSQSNKGMNSKKLFQKELTPSDVSKLNRLVIPKKFAYQFLPRAPMQLCFYDRSMKLWKFRYCYWRSSQSYVFTRGWSWFVKAKTLKANDMIAFLKCESNRGPEGSQTFYMIDVNPEDSSSSNSGSSGLTDPSNALLEEPMQILPGPTIDNDVVEKSNAETEGKGIILFGVRINNLTGM